MLSGQRARLQIEAATAERKGSQDAHLDLPVQLSLGAVKCS
jgi:hypothetical protein